MKGQELKVGGVEDYTQTTLMSREWKQLPNQKTNVDARDQAQVVQLPLFFTCPQCYNGKQLNQRCEECLNDSYEHIGATC